MQNLNKYTKAELISKFKKLDNKNSNKQTLPQNIFNYLVLFKNTLYKLTILTLLIKTFKKYSIIRRIWLFINSIVMAIFGISVLDFYGLSFLASFYTEFTSVVGNVVNYLTNTHFYNVLAGLFANKVDVKQTSKEILRLGTTDSITTGNETRNENSVPKNSKINEWFNRKEEIIDEESDNRKYYLLALLLLLCLTWYYRDEIKTTVNSSIDKIRRRPGNDPDNNPVDLNNPPIIENIPINQPTIETKPNLKDRLKNLFYKKDNSNDVNTNTSEIELVDNTQPVATSSNNNAEYGTYFNTPSSSSSSALSVPSSRLFDKGKEIDTSNLTESEINRRILEQVTGDQLEKFNQESNTVLSRVNLFLVKHENDTIPENIKQGMYNALKAKIVAFSLLSPKLYSDWLNDSNVSNSVAKFLKLKDEINNDNNISEKSEDIQSDTYQEVALATAEEQKAWSEDSNTSVNSPYQLNAIDEEVESIHSQIEQLPNENESMLSHFLQNQDEFFSNKDINQQIEDEITKGIPSIQSRTNLFEQINARRVDTHIIDDFNKELPEIDVDSASNSNNSIEHYLAEPTPQTNIIEQLNARSDVSNIIETPSVTRLGLSPVLEKVKGLFTPKTESKTLHNQGSFSNLLDDTNALFDDLDDNIQIDTTNTNIIENLVDNSNISENNNIKDNSNIDSNTTNIIDNNHIWDNWDHTNNVKVLDNKSISINLKDIWQITKAIHITTYENHDVIFNYTELIHNNLNEDPIKLDISTKIPKLLEAFPDIKLKEVIIEDLNNNFNSVWIGYK